MRKNKKLLLGGLSVLTLVAAGSGAVSTFAWYTVTASITTYTPEDAPANVTVTANAAQGLEYDVIINPVLTPITSAGIKADSSKGLYLSEWNTGHTALETKVNVGGVPTVDANFTDGTTGVLYRIYKVSFYLSHSDFSDPQMTQSQWEGLVSASTQTKDYEFTYVNAASAANDVEITASHLPFYYKAQTEGDVTAMSYSLETAAEPVTGFTTPQVKNISIDSEHPTQVGYLYFRVAGNGWNHDQEHTYVGSLKLDEAA